MYIIKIRSVLRLKVQLMLISFKLSLTLHMFFSLRYNLYIYLTILVQYEGCKH